MTQLTINLTLPDDMGERLRERASETGHRSVEDFVRALLLRELDDQTEDYGAPAHLSVASDEPLGDVLRARVDDPRPPVEATDAFWDTIRERARRAAPENGAK